MSSSYELQLVYHASSSVERHSAKTTKVETGVSLRVFSPRSCSIVSTVSCQGSFQHAHPLPHPTKFCRLRVALGSCCLVLPFQRSPVILRAVATVSVWWLPSFSVVMQLPEQVPWELICQGFGSKSQTRDTEGILLEPVKTSRTANQSAV